jgi:hypothetical protein
MSAGLRGMYNRAQRCKSGNAGNENSGRLQINVPFFNRTTDTFVNLIWFEGWLMPTGMVATKACNVCTNKSKIDRIKPESRAKGYIKLDTGEAVEKQQQ